VTSKTRRNNTLGTSSVKITDCPCTALAVYGIMFFFFFFCPGEQFQNYIYIYTPSAYNILCVVLTCRNVHDWLIFIAIRPRVLNAQCVYTLYYYCNAEDNVETRRYFNFKRLTRIIIFPCSRSACILYLRRVIIVYTYIIYVLL